MAERIRSLILNQYENQSAIQYRKANLLFITNSIVSVTALVLPLLVYSLRGVILWVSLISMTLFLGMCTSIVLLRSGRYTFAANLTSAVSLIALCLGIVYQQYQMGEVRIGYSSMMYLLPVTIVSASLFCTRLWTTAIMIVSLLMDIVYFGYLRGTGAINHLTLSAGFIDSMFAILLAYSVSMLIVKMNRDSMSDIKRELERNIEQYSQIKMLHESITDTSGILVKTSEELSSMAEHFSENAMVQLASAEEIHSSVEEMKANMDLVADDSQGQYTSLEVLLERMNMLSSSILDMKSIIGNMSGVSDETFEQTKFAENILDDMNRTMMAIAESSKQMKTIVDVINEISDKISLLSLNAAIEAARAKEAGRGFSVVANEISKLSIITTDSLKEITGLIHKTESSLNEGMKKATVIIDLMRITIRNVGSITGWMSRINEGIAVQVDMNHQVNQQALQVRDRSERIRMSAGEQKYGLAEVALSISSMTDLNQSFSTTAVQLAGTTREIASIAERVRTQLTL
jgi:methyl-accepting chemotaxis protein